MLETIKVINTSESKPINAIVYGKGGTGKTRFLANAIKDSKNGLLIQCGEDGLSEHTDLHDTPHYENIIGVSTDSNKLSDEWIWFKEDLIKYFMLKDHEFIRLGFDNLDNLINNNLDAYVVKTYYNGNINKANSYGGQKYREMANELSLIIKAFEYLQRKGIEIFISTHGQTVNFKDPSGDDYKKWSLNLPAIEGANLRDILIYWSSITMFGTMETEVEKKKASGGRMILRTNIDPAWDSKCRYHNIPSIIDFNYDAFKQAINNK
jgi:hypothetical protein